MKILRLFVAFTLVCFAFSQTAQTVVPPPPGGYPNFTTAAGDHALQALTSGVGNTAIGTFSLFDVSTGNFNTAVGAGSLDLNQADFNTAVGAAALLFNTTGTQNTANGTAALELNESGSQNTAVGTFALYNNTTGNDNTATGAAALLSNSGAQNTATGSQALLSNTTGSENTAVGYQALFSATTGANNTAVGRQALRDNSTGGDNTAVGRDALAQNTTGSNNIALGVGAGVDLISGDDNIYIGNLGTNEANTIRIGDSQTGAFIAGISGIPVTGTAVVVNVFGQLGVVPSSKQFKEAITPMNNASESILSLQPVTFRYKKKIDPAGTLQFGLVAEDVEKINPALVVRDKQGKAYSVRYDQVNAMLLNEFLKEHSTVQELKANTAKQEATIAHLEQQVKDLAAGLQKVSAQLELRKATPRTALNEG